MHFSKRTPDHLGPNEWSEEQAGLSRDEMLDLTLSNPTECGLNYPKELLVPLSNPTSLSYQPDPFGSQSAREVLADYLSRKGPQVHPDQLLLTSSTSEAYSFLFKLLADPGDSFLYRVPGYPLLEHLARLEGVQLVPFPSLPERNWALNKAQLSKIPPPRCRGFILVDPNNPTGNYLSSEDKILLQDHLLKHSLAYISDEVFFDFHYPGHEPRPWIPTRCLSFRLGGLSKSLGLPQLKLSWIVLSGPTQAVQECRERLELIADTYLSVNGPVQQALPKLLEWAPHFQSQLLERILRNRGSLEKTARAWDRIRVRPAQGGWYALLELLGEEKNDEELAVELLKKERVLVHPGGFYDLLGGKFFVISLLPPPNRFDEGVGKVVRFFKARSL